MAVTSFFLLLMAGIASVVSVEAQSPPPAFDEAEAQAIGRMLMCPVCPGETIDQSQAELARQMRQTVRDMLSAGSTRQEILKFFVDRYGPGVLAAPPKSGFNLLAWVFPFAAAAVGLLAAWLVLRSMTQGRGARPAGEVVASPAPDADLEPYLEIVDREVGRSSSESSRLDQHG